MICRSLRCWGSGEDDARSSTGCLSFCAGIIGVVLFSRFPCCVLSYLSWNTTDKYKYKISWVGQSTTVDPSKPLTFVCFYSVLATKSSSHNSRNRQTNATLTVCLSLPKSLKLKLKVAVKSIFHNKCSVLSRIANIVMTKKPGKLTSIQARLASQPAQYLPDPAKALISLVTTNLAGSRTE